MNQLIEQGREFYRQNKYTELVACWADAYERKQYQSWTKEEQQKFFDLLYRAYNRLNNIEKSEQVIETAFKLLPDSYDIVFLWGYVLMRKQEWERATIRWQNVDLRFPGKIAVYQELASAYAKLKDYEHAEDAIRKGLALKSNDPNLLIEYSRLGMAKKQWQEAITRWQKVVDSAPKLHNGYVGIAMCQRELGNIPAAMTIIDKGLTLLKDNKHLIAEKNRLAKFAKS